MPLLLVVLALVPVVVAVRLGARPAGETRLNAFAARHGLVPPLDRARLVAYLSVTRRTRVVGVTCAYLATLAWMWPQRRVGVDVAVLLCGWLVAAFVAELRLNARATGGGARADLDIGRWPRWIPAFLAAAALGLAAATRLADPPGLAGGGIVGWAAVGVAGAAVVAATVATVGRRAWPPDGTDTARATRVHSIMAVTAGGILTVTGAVVHQLDTLRAALFGPAAEATGTIEVLLTLAAVVAAWIVHRAAWTPGPTAPAPVMAPRRQVAAALTAVVALLAACALVGAYGWRRDRPPYQPEDLAATATVRLTDADHFAADATALGITDLTPLIDGRRTQMFVGRVDYRVPVAARGAGAYYLVAIDRRTNRLAPGFYGHDGGGWYGYLSQVPRKYPWLSAMAPVRHGAGWTTSGQAVVVPSDRPAPITFEGLFPDRAGMDPADIMLVLIFIGDDEQIFWARPLT